VKIYLDPERPLEERIADLLGRMTLAEKAGMMFQPMAMLPPDGAFAADISPFGHLPSLRTLCEKHINHFGQVGAAPPRAAAAWHNALQRLAASTRLGIPITLACDPRHSFFDNLGAHMHNPAFSQWPEAPGLAAIGDAALVEEFAHIARQEYLALGLRAALHPMADLATEPRWARPAALA